MFFNSFFLFGFGYLLVFGSFLFVPLTPNKYKNTTLCFLPFTRDTKKFWVTTLLTPYPEKIFPLKYKGAIPQRVLSSFYLFRESLEKLLPEKIR